MLKMSIAICRYEPRRWAEEYGPARRCRDDVTRTCAAPLECRPLPALQATNALSAASRWVRHQDVADAMRYRHKHNRRGSHVELILIVTLALVLIDSVERWRHPEDYQVCSKQRRDWRAKGREW